MTDEKRIERLTELARKAWPHVRDQLVIETVDGGAMVTCTSTTSSFDGRPGQDVTSYHVRIPGPRGLDALEAALRALAGEPPLVGTNPDEVVGRMQAQLRASEAEAKLAALQASIGALAAKWRAGIDDNWEDYPVVEDALGELIEAAKAGR